MAQSELNGKFLFMELAEVLGKYDLLKTKYHDQDMIGRGLPTYETRHNMTYLNIALEYIAPYGNNTYTECTHNIVIQPYMGKMELKDLPVQPFVDLDSIDTFVHRGGRFKEFTQKPTYMHANGYMYVPTWGGHKRLPLNSRIVIDPEGYKKYQEADQWHNSKTLDTIPDDMCSFTLPCVPAYSFEYKRWGEVPVDCIKEIKYDETAFDRTVLSDDYKSLIKNLVLNFYKTDCCDFIANKKRGLVFLLNGLPGVGKTLTAHGIAELSHRPLYTISSGDIGTNPDEIDANLHRIFEMVGNWGGIVLIDEADVFMATRSDYDINYNSCVSVFLRLIESYIGILFLTTNRHHTIDPAFDSRIHIRLHYKDLDEEGRAKVWTESFNRYQIKNINAELLKVYKLNNREIANIVQLAYISTGGDPLNVTYELIEQFINLRQNFNV